MANQVEITITADPTNAEAGFKKVKSGFQSVKDSIVKNRKIIGLGIAAMGVGIEGLAKSQQGLTESSRKLANATGMSEQEIRGMATSLSNATFPLDEALGLMTLGAQQGLDSADALKQYAAFWDTVGDATGLSSEALAKAGAALAAVGIEVGNESELLGAFGLITRESTQSVQDFLNSVSLLAPELSDVGISADEAAVIMTAMEREMGKVGRTARTEFKEALEASETGLAGVLEQLRLSEAQFARYSAKLGESTGVMAEEAAALASTKTGMDKLKSSMSDLMFANGALIEKASMLAPIFLAAGPVVTGFSGIMGLLNGITLASTVSFMGLNVAMLPLTAIIVGIGLAIAAGILIWKNWDTIINALKKTLDVLKETFWTVFAFIKEIVSRVFAKITDIYESKLGWLLPSGPLIKAILFLKNNWKEIWDSIKATFDRVTGGLIGAFRTIKSTILGIWDGLVSGIKSGINTVIGGINSFIRAVNNIKISFPGKKLKFAPDIPAFSIGMPQIPEIPTLAKGGIVSSPTLAMLGESGPEAVVPLGRGGTGMTVNLVINGDINGMDDFEQKVTSVIRDAVLGGGFSGVLARA